MTDSTNEVTLKPCPFCGADAASVMNDGFKYGPYKTLCRGCGCTTSCHMSADAAASAWNTRLTHAGSSQPADQAVERAQWVSDADRRAAIRAAQLSAEKDYGIAWHRLEEISRVELILEALATIQPAQASDAIAAPNNGVTFSDAVEHFQESGGLDKVVSQASDTAIPAGEVEVRWRERWYGSEPQKGSAITDERGNLIAYFGGDEATHAAVTKIVSAHNSMHAAIAASQPAQTSGDGWVLVPVEPTEAMIHAVWKATLGGSLLSAERAARAMLAARPSQGESVERLVEALPEVLPGHWTTDGGRDMALATLDDPHMARSRERISDFALANEVFLSPGIANLTDAKERIRWLSAMLALSTPAVTAEWGE